MARRNIIVLEMEGPLTPGPSLPRVAALLPEGRALHAALERYDRLCALRGAEAGQVYALLFPFLLSHGITQERIAGAGREAPLTAGARELLSWLKERGWRVFCLTSAYDHYTYPVLDRLGFPTGHVACTRLTIARFQGYLRFLGAANLDEVPALERELLRLEPGKDDDRLQAVLDHYFVEVLPGTNLGGMVLAVKPLVGNRKQEALWAIARETGHAVGEVAFVGDAGASGALLRKVQRRGGLAVAVSADGRAPGDLGVTVVTPPLDALEPVLEEWERHGAAGPSTGSGQAPSTGLRAGARQEG